MTRWAATILPAFGCIATVVASVVAPAPVEASAALDTATAASLDLAAAVSLNMGGTSMGDPGQGYAVAMTEKYINPFFGVTIAPENQHVVTYPAQLWPVSCSGAPLRDCLTLDASEKQGLINLAQAISLYPDDTKYILGYSQSTQIQTYIKRTIMLDALMSGGEFDDYPDVKMSLVANINKPNGGILERFAWAWPTPTTLQPLGITSYGPTPTNTPADPDNPGDHAIDTVNFSFVYDGMGDFPVNPLNLLAVVNAVMGIAFLHSTYPAQTDITPDNPRVFYQGSYQDSDYYMITNELIPLLKPLQDLGVPRPVLLFLNAPLQVLIETGYDRLASPGQPMPFRLTFHNPLTVAANLVGSLAVGFDDAAEDLGNGRPLNTTPAGPFGVGGPTGPIPDPTADPTAAAVARSGDAAPTRAASRSVTDRPGPPRDAERSRRAGSAAATPDTERATANRHRATAGSRGVDP